MRMAAVMNRFKLPGGIVMNQNRRRILFSFGFALVLLLCTACARTQEASERSIFQEFTRTSDSLKIQSLNAGMDVDAALSALGLTREDCKSTESKALPGTVVYRPLTGYTFSEFDPYITDIQLYFNDAGLYTVSYNVAFWDTEFADAFALAENAYQKIDEYLDAQGYTFGSSLEELAKGDLLDQAFTKCWKIGEQNIEFTLAHQDWSDARVQTDNETVVSLQLNIPL